METRQEFEALVLKLDWQIFNFGIDELKKAEIIREDAELLPAINKSHSVMRRFVRGCHYGFEVAQRTISETVIQYECQIRLLLTELRQARRKGEIEAASNITTKVSELKHRQLILRRLADSILQHLVAKEPWILRRMQTSDDIHRIDPNTLATTQAIASKLNRADRTAFHVIADLTTAVQIGDLIKLSFDDKREWEIIELKEGKVNSMLKEIIDETTTPEPELITEIEAKLGDKAAIQAKRMLRQKSREDEIRNFRTKDRGVDPKAQVNVFLRPDIVIVDDYWSAIQEVCLRGRRTDIGATNLDNCLNLIAVSQQLKERLGHHGIAHSFLHINETECYLGNPDKVDAELRKIDEMSPILDLCSMNLEAMWPKPIFMWPIEKEYILDLIFGRLYLYAQLDFGRFFARAATKGIQLDWYQKQSEIVRSPKIPGSPNAHGLIASVPAHPEWSEQILFAGFIGRIFLEIMRPDQLLDMILDDFRNPLKPASCAARGT